MGPARNIPSAPAPALAALALAIGLTPACRPPPGDPPAQESDGTESPTTSGGTTAAAASCSGDCSGSADEAGSTTTAGASSLTDPFTTGASDTQTTGGSNVPMPEEVDYEFCELDWPQSASVTGTTPEGPFNGLYAWFGWLTCNGDGLSPTLVLLEDPADLAAAVAISPSGDAIPTPSIEWYLFGACSPAGGWVGEGNVTVYLRTDGPWHQAGGQIEIFDTHRIFDVVDPDDPPRMHGFVSIHEGAWDLEGEFEAAYCGPLSYPLGCE